MRLLFVETPAFTRQSREHLDDEELVRLQRALLVSPDAGAVIPGTGGFRKLLAGREAEQRQAWRLTRRVLLDSIGGAAVAVRDLREGRGKRLDGRGKARAKGRDRRRAERKAVAVVTKKHRLFDDLMEGIATMRAHREGKITLRTHRIAEPPALVVDGALIRGTRKRMGLSRAVFARCLRTSTRTLETWEHGRSKPNAQAAALILMVREYPDTLHRLQALGIRSARGKLKWVGNLEAMRTDK